MRIKGKKVEFSKLVVALVMLTYFIGIIIGGIVVLMGAYDQLTGYLTFIGTATATTIGFYCWKAKNENIHKNPDVMIDNNQNGIDDTIENISDITDININDEAAKG